MTDWRMPTDHHLPSDVAENLDFTGVLDAMRLVHAVAKALPAALAVRS